MPLAKVLDLATELRQPERERLRRRPDRRRREPHHPRRSDTEPASQGVATDETASYASFSRLCTPCALHGLRTRAKGEAVMGVPGLPVMCSAHVWEQLSEETRRQVLEECGKAVQTKIAGKIEWSEELGRVIALLQEGQASKSDVAAFWVRLHGVLEMVLDEHVSRELFEPQNPAQERMLRVVRELDEKAQVLLACISDEERILIEYERHRASHPFLDKYFLSFKGNTPTIRETRLCGLLGRSLPLSEIRRILDAFEARGSSDVHATALAHRVAGPARSFLESLTAKHEIFERLP